MNVDEMNLASQLREVAPLRPEAYERARTTLRAAMAESEQEAAPVPAAVPLGERGLPRARRRHRLGTMGKVGFGAGIGAVAAGVAVALVATSAPRPATSAGVASQATGSHSQAPGSASRAAGSASKAPAAGSPLVTLAAHITADSSPLPGDASLIIRNQAIGSQPPDVTYSLYADNGALYSGDDKATLMHAVARHENIADGMDAGDVKAALYAATGDPTIARKQMATVSPADAWLFLTGAAQREAWNKLMAQEWPILKQKGVKTPPKMPTGQVLQSIIDNRVWNNGVEALSAGGGNPEVRAGVLRLLSTISAVTVAHSTTGGQPTLTLTAGPEVIGAPSTQVLTINAQTGMPISSVMPAEGSVPRSVDTYQVSRVTLAKVEAGNF